MLYAVGTNTEGLATSMLMFEGSSDEIPGEGFFIFDRYEDAVDKINKKWNGSTWGTVPEPEPLSPPEPTQEELNNLALMEGIAGLYETQVALEERMVIDNLTVMEGIAGLFEAQMGGV